MVEQVTGFLGVGVDRGRPVVRAGVDGGVKDVGEIVGQRGEVAGAHVQGDRGDVGGGEAIPVFLVAQARGTPDLVVAREGTRDRERDLAGGAGDEDLLCVEHPISHSALGRRMLST